MSKEKKYYIAVVKNDYLRDAQVFNPDERFDFSNKDIHSYEYDKLWEDESDKDLFLGAYLWDEDTDALIDYVALKHGYNKNIIAVLEM